jgi:hypothetical protein
MSILKVPFQTAIPMPLSYIVRTQISDGNEGDSPSVLLISLDNLNRHVLRARVQTNTPLQTNFIEIATVAAVLVKEVVAALPARRDAADVLAADDAEVFKTNEAARDVVERDAEERCTTTEREVDEGWRREVAEVGDVPDVADFAGVGGGEAEGCEDEDEGEEGFESHGGCALRVCYVRRVVKGGGGEKGDLRGSRC